MTKTWTEPEGVLNFGEYALDYMKAGADAVGGCCTTSVPQIVETVKVREIFLSIGGRPITYKGY